MSLLLENCRCVRIPHADNNCSYNVEQYCVRRLDVVVFNATKDSLITLSIDHSDRQKEN